jgi:hypothetical protein
VAAAEFQTTATCWIGPRPSSPQRRISPRHEPLPTAGHLIPEFERSPTDPLHLLLLKDIRRTLGR